LERLDEQLYDLAVELVEGMGYSLVTVKDVVEHGRRIFRFTIDHHQGVRHSDCAAVSRELSDLFDVDLDFAGSYVLEVSSPGLDHGLRKPREYAHFAGRTARIVLRTPIEDANVVTGVIVHAEPESVTLNADGVEVSIPFENISRARLVP
jgi:ribosome maturation factor RimP